ncbi:MAG: 50S ribosomal protein L20 [bacterium]|nr:50S ribosomal protein L20 [bacterium]
MRVKRGTIANKRRKKVLKYTKGFRWSRKSKFRAAKEALLHAWSHAFVGRKLKKRQNRAIWNVQINAASRENGLTYGKLIFGLKKANIVLNRKMLSELAQKYPDVFKEILLKSGSVKTSS